MASRSCVSVHYKLALFLITTAFLSVTALYFDLRVKNADLRRQVEKLKASRVLLVVPDEQAGALSEWLNSHPESVDSLIRQGQGNIQSDKPDKPEITPAAENKTDGKKSPAADKTDFSGDGIKTRKPPRGGIRVTTRSE